jgi:SPP1 gp7 family putative phage head morphogenesis protein
MDLDKIIHTAIRNVYNGKLKAGDLDADLWRANVEAMWAGIDKGLSKPFINTAYTDDLYSLASSMRENVMLFAAFKNHHNINDMVAALQGANGEPHTWEEFKKLALGLNANYNTLWLKAEYHTAQAAALMGEKWKDMYALKKHLPYLRYDTVHDSRVRPEHKVLDGVTRHIDDPFWDVWYPPNGWSCRCSVQQVAGGETELPVQLPTKSQTPPEFRINPGKTGMIFSPQHPYFTNVTNTRQRANLIRGMSNLILDQELPIFHALPGMDKTIQLMNDKALPQTMPIMIVEEIASIHHYTDTAFTAINEDLRTGNLSEKSKVMYKIMDRALRKLPNHQGMVYRGTNLPISVVAEYQKAFDTKTPFLEKAFFSTSQKQTTIKDFQSWDKVAGNVEVQFTVYSKTGKLIEQMSKYGTIFAETSEAEVLFKPNTTFTVVSINIDTKGIFEIKLLEL